MLFLSSLGVEDWSAPEKGGGGSSEKPLAAQILDRLRAVNEDAGDNWTWSSYLLPEACCQKEARDD